jgi:hypothetical protein
MSEEPFDFLTPLEQLAEGGVRFVVIGGVAASLHGSNVITSDLDICYARDDENLERLARVLAGLGARLRGAPKDIRFLLDAKTLRKGDHFTFTTRMGPLDLLGTPAGMPGGYEALERGAEEFDLEGISVKVASIDDLITMKRSAGRPKDLRMVEELGALRDEIDARAAEERKRKRGR